MSDNTTPESKPEETQEPIKTPSKKAFKMNPLYNVGAGLLIMIFSVCYYQAELESKAKVKIDEKIAKMSDTSYSDVSVNILTQSLTIHDLKNDKSSLESLTIYNFDEVNKLPRFVSASFTGLKMSVSDLKPEAKEMLKDVYTDKFIYVSGLLDYNYNTESKAFDTAVSLSMRNLFEVSAGLQVEGVNLDSAEDAFGSFLNQGKGVKLDAVSMTFTDFGLAKFHLDKEGAGDKLVAELDKKIEDESGIKKEILEAVKAFSKNPQNITLSIDPKTPFEITQFKEMSESTGNEVLAKLNVRVIANQ